MQRYFADHMHLFHIILYFFFVFFIKISQMSIVGASRINLNGVIYLRLFSICLSFFFFFLFLFLFFSLLALFHLLPLLLPSSPSSSFFLSCFSWVFSRAPSLPLPVLPSSSSFSSLSTLSLSFATLTALKDTI